MTEHKHKFTSSSLSGEEHTYDRYEKVYSYKCNIPGCKKYQHICWGWSYRLKKSLDRVEINDSCFPTEVI